MIKAVNVGKYVFAVGGFKSEVAKVYVNAEVNINFVYDHCPRVSLDIGIGKYMLELSICYQYHRTEYDETPDTGSGGF